jgi:hypothetical protein
MASNLDLESCLQTEMLLDKDEEGCRLSWFRALQGDDMPEG